MIKGIYFVDGDIRPLVSNIFNSLCEKHKMRGYIIDAACGISRGKRYAEQLEQSHPDSFVLTNQIVLLSNEYAWKDNQCKAYLWHHDDAEFINLQDLTDKDIRNAHNLSKMYIAGSFGYKGIPKN